MLAAHMDEIGLIVTHIDDEGFLRISQIGGVTPHIALAQRVLFANGTVGVVGAEPVKDLKELKLDKLYVDIGAGSKEEAKKRVSIGDSAVFYHQVQELNGRVVSKALDDRIGCVILTRVLETLEDTPHDVYFVFTAQEEDGAWAARTAAYSIDPDLGIACDVTGTGDTPEARKMAVKLGGGAAIKVRDRSAIVHPRVRALLQETAEELGIAHQFEVLEYGETDAGVIQTTRAGVPSGCISVPCRYVHTPSEVVDLENVQACIELFRGVLARPIDF
jgi:endoglucanase